MLQMSFPYKYRLSVIYWYYLAIMNGAFTFVNSGCVDDPIDVESPYVVTSCCVCLESIDCSVDSPVKCLRCSTLLCVSCVHRLCSRGVDFLWFRCPICRFDGNGLRRGGSMRTLPSVNDPDVDASFLRLDRDMELHIEFSICFASLLAGEYVAFDDYNRYLEHPQDLFKLFSEVRRSASSFIRTFASMRENRLGDQ